MLSLYSRFSELETIYIGKRRICGPLWTLGGGSILVCVQEIPKRQVAVHFFALGRISVARMDFILHVIYAIGDQASFCPH